MNLTGLTHRIFILVYLYRQQAVHPVLSCKHRCQLKLKKWSAAPCVSQLCAGCFAGNQQLCDRNYTAWMERMKVEHACTYNFQKSKFNYWTLHPSEKVPQGLSKVAEPTVTADMVWWRSACYPSQASDDDVEKLGKSRHNLGNPRTKFWGKSVTAPVTDPVNEVLRLFVIVDILSRWRISCTLVAMTTDNKVTIYCWKRHPLNIEGEKNLCVAICAYHEG